MRAMAIDYGAKRVGVASTDESGQFALPRMVLDNDDTLIDKIVAFKNDSNIDKVVIGESKNLDGAPNPIQSEINQFILRLKERGLETISHPEVFTTVEARHLQGNTEMTDASAAAILLKSWLESVYNK
jgi:putative Holliday junction resolvase